MKITSAEFIKSAFAREHWVSDGKPEIAFLGRSNVGKSSLINSLLQRKGLARTSNTPGRTQSINYFLINGSFYFVDLPGYGYARVSKAMRADWGAMAEDYLSESHNLRLCVQLVDSRHEPTGLDMDLAEWLQFHEKETLIAATKSDKLSSNKLQKSLSELKKALPLRQIIPFSAFSGAGRDQIWHEIEKKITKR